MKAQTALFSIVVPVYKCEKYIKACVDSVLGQTCGDFELIIVDDGSPDNSGAMCDVYAAKDGRIRVIHKENGGPTSARTKGAEAATGEYIILLDSDDYIDACLLEKMAEILRNYGPDAILFSAKGFGGSSEDSYDCLIPEGLYAKSENKAVLSGLIFNDAGELAIPYGVHMKVFRREMYVRFQNMVPKNLYKGEDLCVVAPLICECESVYVSHFCGYFYRCTEGSIMNKFRFDDIIQVQGVADYLSAHMPESYQSRIDNYVVTHVFDFLDRAMVEYGSWNEYRKVVKKGISPEISTYLSRSVCLTEKRNEQLAFYLTKYRLFNLLWLIRKIYRP